MILVISSPSISTTGLATWIRLSVESARKKEGTGSYTTNINIQKTKDVYRTLTLH